MRRSIAARLRAFLIVFAPAFAPSGAFSQSGAPGPDSERPVTIVPHGANPVSIWNEVAVATALVRPAVSGATPSERFAGPDVVTVQLAIYDAVMAIAKTHKPFAIQPTVPASGASMEAAAIEAAYRVLKDLFPSRGDKYEAAYANGMADVPDGDAKARGRAIGAEVAAGMVALRTKDGRETALSPYVPGTAPGQFRGVDPILRIAQYIKPFATDSHAQFRAPGAPGLGTKRYADDLAEVHALGSAGGLGRSAAQTEMARFHTEPPGAFWSRNLRQFATASADLAVNARLAAMVWTAYQDAIGACFESKYHHNFWRPASAVQLADTDGNPATQPDPDWAPHLPTPNHPEYPAAHSCVSAAVAETLRSFYGTRRLRFEFNSAVAGTVAHRYERTDDLVDEIANARVWGGMHFRTSTTDGAQLGTGVARWVAARHFRPIVD
jgi:hypothetical protein